jgi:hypothetical protein
MDNRTGEEEPPKSTDLDGWRQAIADDRLRVFRLEALAAAFQDLGGRDTRVRHALAKHLSDSIVHMLRGKVGFNYPDEGRDIIFRTHEYIFTALLRPRSADGRGLRVAFGPRVLFRLKDAILDEQRERQIPDETKPDKRLTTEVPNESSDGEDIEISASAEDLGWDEEQDELRSRREVGSKRQIEASIDETGVQDERINVEGILDCVKDPRKRLAFHLYMEGFPYKTKRKNVVSIAQALSVSEKTARDWVEEVRQNLEENEGVQHLKKLRMGTRS